MPKVSLDGKTETYAPRELPVKFAEMHQREKREKESVKRDVYNAGEHFFKDTFKQVMGIPTVGTFGKSKEAREAWTGWLREGLVTAERFKEYWGYVPAEEIRE